LATQRNGAQQQPPQQRITVDGFELKNFLAIAQKVREELSELLKK